ncbi:MAG: hypothetical protein ACI8P0_002054 [Planctomycetaceae bacterium]|jgi:hypothetical protein
MAESNRRLRPVLRWSVDYAEEKFGDSFCNDAGIQKERVSHTAVQAGA